MWYGSQKRKTSSKITYEPLEGTKSCAVRQPESVGFTYSFFNFGFSSTLIYLLRQNRMQATNPPTFRCFSSERDSSLGKGPCFFSSSVTQWVPLGSAQGAPNKNIRYVTYVLNRFPGHDGFPIGKINDQLKTNPGHGCY